MHCLFSHLLHTQNILVSEQHGLRIGMCTENAACSLTNSVTLHVGGILCGLAKACGCMNHEILLDKLDRGVNADCYSMCWWQQWQNFVTENLEVSVQCKP
jgi:hypothetical protein